jgi:membrane-bound metal-dependent hydrolase YbcI (DUF457 family)
MPSPVGHAIAGVAAGWLVAPQARASRGRTLRAAAFALAATIADIDLLVGTHRGPTHSLAAALLAGIATWVWFAVGSATGPVKGDGLCIARDDRPLRFALAMTAAYATHTLLDWLGSDSSPPIGIMALWPFNREYYESPLHVFMAISRRYWLPDFWTLNARAIARELVILGPVSGFVLWLRRPKAES